MKTTVIIPNYNGLLFLKPCLESLDKQTKKDFKILVIDNGSTDGSVEWLKQHNITSVLLPQNIGFSGAVNIGIKKATTPYVILLNNDTKADSQYIEELEKAMDSSENVFSISSKMLQMQNKELIDDAGDMYSLMGWAFQRGVGRSKRFYNKSYNIFSACAGAAIYRREIFDVIGYFDESHFAYLEDIDVGYRAKLYGYKNMYWPKAIVYHVGSGTSGSKYNSFKVKLTSRNNVYLNYKNMRLWQLLLNSPFLLMGLLVKYLFFLKMGFGKDYISGIVEALNTLKKCKRVSNFKGRFKQEIIIQIELIIGTLVYIYEFCRRQMLKVNSR